MKIIAINKNCLGTLNLVCKFDGMRKAQGFIVYPLKAGDDTGRIMIQSDTRIGHIYMGSGEVHLCKPVSSGAYAPHLIFASKVDVLSEDELVNLKLSLFQTKGERVGNNGIMYCDNSAAENVLTF